MFIQHLKEINRNHINETIEAVVLLSDIKIKRAKNEKRYADIIIQDASKMMEAKFWDYEEKAEEMQCLQVNEVIRIQGVVGEYQGQLQLVIKEMEKAAEKDIDIKTLIPTSSWELESMEKGLQIFYDKVQSPHFKSLLDKMIFKSEYYEKFCTYPAARRVHHNYYHGLLQHTLEVLKFAHTVASTKKLSQRQMDRLIVMTFLHDWAKMIEYKSLPQVGYTEEGTMLGHIFIGAHHTLNFIKEIEGFDEEDKLVILNGLLGHHGNLEWGSPVLPKTVEAQILHQADKMSGDVESILSFIKEHEEEEELFTKKLWNMGTEYYKK
jgi:3'-5' exoribonuclease